MATIQCSGKDNGTMESFPPIVEKFLEENKDVMLDELPKTLPPRHEIADKIALEIRSKPPAHTPYHMAPPELEELRK